MKKRFMRQKRGQRGSTIYELVIAMVLTAVICALVLTFSAFLTDYLDTAESLNKTLSEVSTTRSAIEKWFSVFDNENYTLSMKRSDTPYTQTYGEEIYTISAADGDGEVYTAEMYSADDQAYLLLEYPHPNEDMVVYCSYVDTVNFQKLAESNVYRCEIAYGANLLRFMLVSHTGGAQP